MYVPCQVKEERFTPPVPTTVKKHRSLGINVINYLFQNQSLPAHSARSYCITNGTTAGSYVRVQIGQDPLHILYKEWMIDIRWIFLRICDATGRWVDVYLCRETTIHLMSGSDAALSRSSFTNSYCMDRKEYSIFVDVIKKWTFFLIERIELVSESEVTYNYPEVMKALPCDFYCDSFPLFYWRCEVMPGLFCSFFVWKIA